ncbi:hypothetical protein [Bacillus sp. JJ722]|uniref:hypothetical protein n=1 Tax=Bacillus sp. JJ722 TaxID=3122973 RepID=UPI002FFFC31A
MKLYNPMPVSEAQRRREEASEHLQNIGMLPTTIYDLKQENALLLMQDAAKTQEIANINSILAKNGIS